MLDPEECDHPMARRSWRKATVRGERLKVEHCADCGIDILSPWDSERLSHKSRAIKPVRQ